MNSLGGSHLFCVLKDVGVNNIMSNKQIEDGIDCILLLEYNLFVHI